MELGGGERGGTKTTNNSLARGQPIKPNPNGQTYARLTGYITVGQRSTTAGIGLSGRCEMSDFGS